MYSVIGLDMVEYLLNSNAILLQVQGGICRGDPGTAKVLNTVGCIVVPVYTHVHSHRNNPIHRRLVDMAGAVGCREVLVQLPHAFHPGRGPGFQASPLALHNQELVSS